MQPKQNEKVRFISTSRKFNPDVVHQSFTLKSNQKAGSRNRSTLPAWTE